MPYPTMIQANRLFCSIAAAVLLASCGGGGGGSSTPVTPPQQPAPTVDFTASPSTIGPAATATLAWSSTNATGCTASGGWSGNKAVSGSEATNPLISGATFTLSCSGPGGATTKSAAVAVAPAATLTLSVSPTVVQKGSPATLTWSAANASECLASGAWAGAKPASGTQSTGPLASSATYTLECRGNGSTASQSVAVTVNQPPTDPPAPTLTLTASPTTVSTGTSATLTWASTNATDCVAFGNWSGAKAVNGSAPTGNLTASSSFDLTCTGAGGSVTRSVFVVVVVPPPTPSISLAATPVTTNPGSTRLEWTASNASSCVASGAWSGVQPTSGSANFSGLTAATTYLLTCSGPGGSATQSVTVSVPPPVPAPTVAIAASPASIQQGNAATLTWSSSNATACSASGDWTGARPTSGSQSTGTLSAPGTFTYTLTCTGAGGSDGKSAVVTVTAAPPPPGLTFDVNPTLISTGGSAVLTWSASNAAGCTASNGWTGARPTNGAETISGITATTTFTLTCSGAGGNVAKDVTVTVWTPTPAPTVTLTGPSQPVDQGMTGTLTWSSTNAASCVGSDGWSGSIATSGTAPTAPLNLSTVYTLTCQGPGGSASASTTVLVKPAAVLFPISAPAGTRRLVDKNGRPFLVVGDAPWSLMTGLNKTDVIAYLNDRQQRGFNTLVVNIVEHFFNGPVNQEGNAPFAKTAGVYDFSQPNPAYFAHVDYVLAEAAKRGFLVLLTPAYLGFGGGAEGWWPEINTGVNSGAVMLNYGRYLGDRYKTYNNILWVMGGDWYDSVSLQPPPMLSVTRAIVQGIQERDPAKLFTAHNARQESALEYYSGESWLTVNTTYSDCIQTPQRSINDYSRAKVMPAVYFEGTYENENNASPQCLRSQAFWPVLLGATGSVFGNYPIWSFDPQSTIGLWPQWLDSPGARGMTNFRKLFLSRAWDKLVPSLDGSVLTAGQGALGSNYAAVAVASGGDSVIVYTPSKRDLTINMAKVGGSTARAWWFNPANGDSTLIGDFATAGSRVFSPPSAQDWVLVIDNAALGLAAPGL